MAHIFQYHNFNILLKIDYNEYLNCDVLNQLLYSQKADAIFLFSIKKNITNSSKYNKCIRLGNQISAGMYIQKDKIGALFNRIFYNKSNKTDSLYF